MTLGTEFSFRTTRKMPTTKPQQQSSSAAGADDEEPPSTRPLSDNAVTQDRPSLVPTDHHNELTMWMDSDQWHTEGPDAQAQVIKYFSSKNNIPVSLIQDLPAGTNAWVDGDRMLPMVVHRIRTQDLETMLSTTVLPQYAPLTELQVICQKLSSCGLGWRKILLVEGPETSERLFQQKLKDHVSVIMTDVNLEFHFTDRPKSSVKLLKRWHQELLLEQGKMKTQTLSEWKATIDQELRSPKFHLGLAIRRQCDSKTVCSKTVLEQAWKQLSSAGELLSQMRILWRTKNRQEGVVDDEEAAAKLETFLFENFCKLQIWTVAESLKIAKDYRTAYAQGWFDILDTDTTILDQKSNQKQAEEQIKPLSSASSGGIIRPKGTTGVSSSSSPEVSSAARRKRAFKKRVFQEEIVHDDDEQGEDYNESADSESSITAIRDTTEDAAIFQRAFQELFETVLLPAAKRLGYQWERERVGQQTVYRVSRLIKGSTKKIHGPCLDSEQAVLEYLMAYQPWKSMEDVILGVVECNRAKYSEEMMAKQKPHKPALRLPYNKRARKSSNRNDSSSPFSIHPVMFARLWMLLKRSGWTKETVTTSRGPDINHHDDDSAAFIYHIPPQFDEDGVCFLESQEAVVDYVLNHKPWVYHDATCTAALGCKPKDPPPAAIAC